jgi:hypothetical protein
MSADDRNGPYLEAVRRGFMVARELGQGCGPVHLLVGVAEGDGPAAAALRPGQGRSLRAIVAGEGAARAAGGYVQMQSQSGALSLAKSRGERVSPEHLLIALIDQATAPVLDALTAAGLDPAAACRRFTFRRSRPRAPPTGRPCRSRISTPGRGPRSAGGGTICPSARSTAPLAGKRCSIWSDRKRGGWPTGSGSTRTSGTRC